MALVASALCTMEEARSWLQIQIPTSQEWSVIERAVNAVSDRIEAELGRQVVARNVTEYYNGTGTTHLFLSQYPVVSVSLIESLNQDGTTYKSYDVAAGKYFVSAVGRLDVRAQLAFLSGVDNVRVTYQPGWSVVPDPIKTGALVWVSEIFRRWQNRRDPIQSVSTAGQTTTYFDAPIPKDTLSVIDRYRVLSAAG